LAPSGTQQFAATVLGTSNPAVTWSINPPLGTISPAGLYTAPSSILTSQTVTVTAQSVADATKSAAAVITLTPPTETFTYYVDSVAGSDSNPGTEVAPWKTVAKVNSTRLTPGQSIAFKAGGVWREQLGIPSSGSVGKPITFTSYGSGPLPIISGADVFTGWTAQRVNTYTVYFVSYSTAPAQVFEDETRLAQITTGHSALSPGQWYLDTTNKYIWVRLTGDDAPGGHAMEASQRAHGIAAYLRSYVTVSGLQTQMANTDGISISSGDGDVITGVLSQKNYGWGVVVGNAPNAEVTSSKATNNGDHGIFFFDSPTVAITHNTVTNNCQLTDDMYCAGIGANDSSRGSTKFLIQGNTVNSNGMGQPGQIGGGIKVDTVGAGGTIRANTVCSNNFAGITLDAVNGENTRSS
jgi:parallel beta-helix repeat protein